MNRTYGNLSFDSSIQRWVIESLDPHVAIRLKQLFPRIAKGRSGKFTIPDSPDSAADLKWFTDRYPLQHLEKDFQYLAGRRDCYLDQQTLAESIKLPDYIPTNRAGLLPGQLLRGYQQVWLDWADLAKPEILL